MSERDQMQDGRARIKVVGAGGVEGELEWQSACA